MSHLLAMLSIGTALRLWRLDDRSMWFDESVSWTTITRFSWPEMVRRTGQAVHPPLYYVCLRLWGGCFGTSLVALRGFSVALAAVTMVGIYLFCRDGWSWSTEHGTGSAKQGAGGGERSGVEGRWIGIVAAGLLATSSFQILWAQQARMYTLGTALAALSSWTLVRALQSGGRSWWIAYSPAAAGLMYTHHYGLFCVAAQACLAGGWFVWRGRGRVAEIVPTRSFAWTCAAFGGVVLLYLPWLPVLSTQTGRVAGSYWIGPVDAWTLPKAWFHLFYPRVAPGEPWRTGVIGVGSTVVALLALSLWRAPPAGWLAVLLVAVPAAGAVMVSLALVPILIPRYFLIAQPFVFCSVGAVLWRAGRLRLRGVLAGVLLLAGLLVHWRTLSRLDVARRPGLRRAVEYVLGQRAASEPVVVIHPAIYHAVRYYAQGAAEVKLYAPQELTHYTGGPLLVPGDRITAGELDRLPGRKLWVLDTTGLGRAFFRFPLPSSWRPLPGSEASFDEVYYYQGQVTVARYARSALPAGRVPVAMVALAADDTTLRFGLSEALGQDFDPRALKLIGGPVPGACCRLEPEGLRCSILAGGGNVRYCGAALRRVVSGDFQITAAYRLTDLPEATAGHGAGLKITIKDEDQRWADVGRLYVPGEGHVYAAHYAEMRDGRYAHSRELTGTEANCGKLRLVRSGGKLEYFVSEGDAGEFTKLREVDFGRGDVMQIHFAALTGGSPTVVDAVWREIQIRADGIHESYRPRRSLWPLVVIVGVLGVMTFFLIARLRRGST